MSPRRLLRRVAFAAPLVVTIAAAPACSHQAPAHTPKPTNPPQPEPGTGPEVGPAATPDKPGAWEQTDTGWRFRYDDGDAVYVDDTGGCHLVFDANCADTSHGPVLHTCNPPPPQDVACPPGRPGT